MQEAIQATGLLYGRFERHQKLGAGGMGIVYRAFDLRRQEYVALKTLEQLSLENVMNLKREFRIAASLRHPNLVRLYDLVSDGTRCAFSMELIEGTNLISYIRSSDIDTPTVSVDSPTTGPQTGGSVLSAVWVPEEGATYNGARLLSSFPQICAGVDALHQEGLVHRDLKPSNILCTPEGIVKILDFGTTKAFRAGFQTEKGQFIEGTPHYMSPEQARGEQVGPPSDMYSLGVILYVLLTGVPPFQGQTTKKILEKHSKEQPQPPSQIARGVPSALEELCLLLLQKDPLQRPTAREVAARLIDIGAPSVEFPKQTISRFVGRGKELKLLSEAAERVIKGERRGVLLGGESGAGKSALVSVLVRKLSISGWRVFAGRCYEREEIPYNAIDSLMDALASFVSESSESFASLEGIDELAAMFPVLRGAARVEASQKGPSAAAAREKAAVALRGLLRLFSKERRLALWIDDLQWADQDSLELLYRLFEEDLPLSFLLLGTYRNSQAPSPALQRLLVHPNISALNLGPLESDAVKSLVGGSAERAQKIIAESHGNAFFASELAFALQSGEVLQGDLNSLLLSRVRRLPAQLQQTLEVVVTAGGSTSFPLLRQLVGVEPSVLVKALDELCYRRWLRVVDTLQDEGYDAYHDRIREVVYTSLSTQRRQELHRRFAQALSATGEPEAVANHYLRAEEPQRAAPWLLRAAQKAASQLAAERASTLYLRALELGGDSWSFAQQAREERASVLDRAGGRYQQAALAYREAAQHTRGASAVRLLIRAAESELKSGEVEAAIQAGEKALAPYETLVLPRTSAAAFIESLWLNLNVEWYLRVHQTLPQRGATEATTLKHLLLHRLAGTLLYFDLMRGTVCAMRSLVLALSEGSTEDMVDAITLYAAFLMLRRGRANLERAEELCARCEPFHGEIKDAEIDIWVKDGSPGVLFFISGQYTKAKERLNQAIQRYSAVGRAAGHEVVAFQTFVAYADSACGDPRAGLALIEPLLARAVAEGDQLALRAYSLCASSLYLLLGELSKVKETVTRLPAELRPHALIAGQPASYFHAAAYLMQGETSRCIALAEEILAEPLENGLIAFNEAKIRTRLLLGSAHLVEAKKAPGARERKASLRKAWSAVSSVLDCDDPVLEGIAFRLAGLVFWARGEEATAKQWLNRSVASLEARGEAIELAAALLARGALEKNPADIKRGQQILQTGHFADPALREGSGWSWSA